MAFDKIFYCNRCGARLSDPRESVPNVALTGAMPSPDHPLQPPLAGWDHAFPSAQG